MSRPYATILLDTFNQERFIEQAVTSVLAQDFPASEMEILVVDDGSSDSTPEILSRFAPRVKLLRKANEGQASAFNCGIPEARGEIIAFLDGDDWWAPDKLSRVAAVMRSEPELGIAGHGITEVRRGGPRIGILSAGTRFRANTVEGARLFRLRKCFLGTSRVTIRTKIATEALPVPRCLVFEADEYLFTLAAVSAETLILPESLTFYRIHDRNMYQASEFTPEGSCRKQEILESLASELRKALVHKGIGAKVIETLAEPIQTEANQLRLMLGGGWPWETARTEWKLFRQACEHATLRHRVFKLSTLLPALFVPPRAYYAARQKLVRHPMYLAARRKWIPVAAPPHITRKEGIRN